MDRRPPAVAATVRRVASLFFISALIGVFTTCSKEPPTPPTGPARDLLSGDQGRRESRDVSGSWSGDVVGPTTEAVSTGLSADGYAASILTPYAAALFRGAALTGGTDGGSDVVQAAVFDDDPGFQGFPTDGGTFLVLSTGLAANTPGTATTFESQSVGGPSLAAGAPQSSPDGLPSNDVVTLSLTFLLPTASHIVLSFDWKFATEENPQFTNPEIPGGPFPDYFRADVFTPAGASDIAMFDGQPVTAVTAVSESNPVGGSSSVSPVPGGEVPLPTDVVYNAVTTSIHTASIDLSAYSGQTVTVQLRVADVKDPVLNSAAFIDNLDISTGSISVTLLDPDENPAAGRVVTAVNSTIGPFRTAGDPTTFTAGVTDGQGLLTLYGLPLPGDYCVHARPLASVNDAKGLSDQLIVPPGSQPPGESPTTDAGAISGSDGGSDAFTNPNYVLDCVNEPPIHLDEESRDASVELSLQQGSSVQFDVLDLNGQSSGLPGWAIIEKTAAEIPWFPTNLPDDVHPGLLVSAAAAGSPVNLTGLPPGIQLVIQSGIGFSQHDPDGNQGVLTFSKVEPAPDGGATQDLGSQVAEPQLCEVNTHEDTKGGGKKGKGDFLTVVDGYRADAQLNRLNEVGIFFDEAGSGKGQLHVLIRLPDGETLNLVSRFECREGTCMGGRANGSAIDAGIMAKAFFASHDGTVRATWSIEGLPADASVEYQLKTPGDQYPERAFQQIAFPPSPCVGGGSNDPRFWTGT